MENKTTILIVDDEAAGRDAIEGALYPDGYRLIFASGGMEAYQKAVEYMPDLLLLDVMMPGTNGFEVCRMIRANQLLTEMPIVMVTALDDRQSRLAGLEAGADDFITKPFDRVELRARVRTITRLNRYRSLILERVRFAWVAEQTSEGYVVLDEGDEIIYANPAAITLLNLTGQFEGQPFLEQVQKRFHLEPDINWSQWPAVNGLMLFLIQPETINSQPTILNVEVLELPNGTQNRMLLRITNATQNLAMQRERWTFHTAISHKLKTPISQIVMAAELIQHQAQTAGNETFREMASALLAGSRRMESEIKEILQYVAISKIPLNSRSLPLEKLPSYIQHLCEDMGVQNTRIQADGRLRQHQLKISLQAIDVILRELIGNAIKFHPRQSPTLQIELSRMDNSMLCLKIGDDGVHLSQEQLAAVWQPYYQAENVYTGEVGGMGLGLSCVANLVWETGGKVRMYNQDHQPGVVAEIQIPIN